MIKILLNTLLGLVLIFIWSRFVNLRQIANIISGTNLLYLGPIFFLLLLSPIIRALRLKIFLAEVKKVKLLDLIFLNGVAIMLNFFIPIRAGEIAKGIYLNTNYQLNLGKSVIWIFLDRFVDFLIVLLLATGFLLVVPTSLGTKFTIMVSIIFILASGFAYLVIFQLKFSQKLAQILKNLLIQKHIRVYFEKFSNFILESFKILDRHPKDLFFMVLLTVLAYCSDGAIWYFMFISLGSHQNYLKMYLGQLLSALTYLVPAAPGYVGSAEASGLLIFSGVFGINADLASATTVLFHIIVAIFTLLFGLLSVFLLKIDLGLILKKALNRT